MQRVIARSFGALLLVVLLLAAQAGSAEASSININTASAAELATLKGVGPAKAQAIIDHREKNGKFKNVDELRLVRGVGEKMLEKLRPQVTVGAQNNAATSAKR